MMGKSYIGRRSCGCLVCAMADDLRKQEIAHELSKWIMDGLTVEYVDDDVVRKEFVVCPHKVKVDPMIHEVVQERTKMAIWNAKASGKRTP